MEPRSPTLQANSLPAEPPGKPPVVWGGGNGEMVGSDDTRLVVKRELTGFDDGLNQEEGEREESGRTPTFLD